jgi:hypothetical protein
MGTFLSCQLHWSQEVPNQLDTQEWDSHNYNVLMHFASVMHSVCIVQDSYKEELTIKLEPPIRFTTYFTPKQVAHFADVTNGALIDQETNGEYVVDVITERQIRHVCTIHNIKYLIAHMEIAARLQQEVRELRSIIQGNILKFIISFFLENPELFSLDMSVASIVEHQEALDNKAKLRQFAKQLDLLLFSRWQPSAQQRLEQTVKVEPVVYPKDETNVETEIELKTESKVEEKKNDLRIVFDKKLSEKRFSLDSRRSSTLLTMSPEKRSSSKASIRFDTPTTVYSVPLTESIDFKSDFHFPFKSSKTQKKKKRKKVGRTFDELT